MKNYAFFLLLLATLVACSDDNSPSKEIKAAIPITTLEVDDTGSTGEEIEIYAEAVAPNGCYSDLEIQLEEIDERHLILTASATRANSNVCPEDLKNLVIRDTVIRFTPQHTGSYYFSANKPDLVILRDTLVVE